MKYIDIDCYERGCACASSNRFAGEDCEVVEIVRHKELTDEEILDAWNDEWVELDKDEMFIEFAREILRKAQEK
jgi:hypothetical protein